MPTVRCKIIPEPAPNSAVVFTRQNLGVFIRGSGPTTYVCGRCKNIIVEKVYHGQVRNIIFKCPKCQSFNHIP